MKGGSVNLIHEVYPGSLAIVTIPLAIVGRRMINETAALADEIRRILVESAGLTCRPEEIGLDQPLFGPGGLGLHSLDLFELTLELETRLGIEIEDPEIPKLKTVGAIVALVESRRRA